ncbi:hypothetical protein JCM6882_005220 [Rhodosporidiobolus microsporus]
MPKSLFLLGTGFIGGSVLTALLEKKQEYAISALSRDDEKSEKLKQLGVRPVKGSLDDDEVIAKEAAEADVILHIATADDLPSVKSILKGLGQRDPSKPPAIYIHTSGTGVLTFPTHPASVVFNDKDPPKFDTLIPDEAPHRTIDLTIKHAAESGKLNAKISILFPPLIYGIGSGPYNQTSIQIPAWAKKVVREKTFTTWGPQHYWNNIHVKNLVNAYLTLLSHLETTTTPPPIYVVAETGEHTWGDVAVVLRKELEARNLLAKDAPSVEFDDGSDASPTGSQRRSRSEWLHEWGWEVERLPSVTESISEELDEMVRQGAFE